ncbi:hypothetical protein M422DRAFT_250298 [Sphaerobolus stellatus SS14]|uniref:Uncharacterized protein n=1 Tax=Sphaerobolus stellatus (strain SS14) TaxID=990650 RepID=A0A0C9VU99_SPHS4|nr:hypothetical protein M422DRAFT_250298 [Sphaerobolus stellatus SS14]
MYLNNPSRTTQIFSQSNSPFELLPVLNKIFHVSTLPEGVCFKEMYQTRFPGSIRLKSYAARPLLPALLSPPTARKREGVVEVLNAFLSRISSSSAIQANKIWNYTLSSQKTGLIKLSVSFSETSRPTRQGMSH